MTSYAKIVNGMFSGTLLFCSGVLFIALYRFERVFSDLGHEAQLALRTYFEAPLLFQLGLLFSLPVFYYGASFKLRPRWLSIVCSTLILLAAVFSVVLLTGALVEEIRVMTERLDAE